MNAARGWAVGPIAAGAAGLAAVLVLMGCGAPEVAPKPADAAPVVVRADDAGAGPAPDLSNGGFHVVRPVQPRSPEELTLSRDSRRVVQGAAVLETTPIEVMPGDRIDLGPAIAAMALHEADARVEVLLETNYPPQIFALAVNGDPESLIVDALPESMREARTRLETAEPLVTHAAVRIVELRPQPLEIWLEPIRPGASTRFEVSVGNASAWKNPARCRIEVASNGARETVFDEVIAFDADVGWREISVPLTAWAGQETQIVLRTDAAPDPKSYAEGSEGLIAPVWADAAYFDAPAATDARPNVILISLDTVRADHLGCYGYEKPTTPNLDAFAAESVLFERCEASTSWTLPSHAAVFTGTHPFFQYTGPEHFYRMSGGFVTLAELARDAGYLTAGFCEGVLVSADRGFAQGFGRYWEGLGHTPHRPGSSAETFANARAWLEARGGHPFFLFVHTYEPHAPYDPPESYRAQFGEGIAAPADYDPAVHHAHSKRMYDGEIAHVDFQLGAFFDYLRARGLMDRTHIIVMSDHGEEFGEHGDTLHMKSLYNESLHVPLIVRLAGETRPAHRVARNVELIDVFATAAELLGAGASSGARSLSLMPLIRPESGGGYEREYAVASLRNLVHRYVMVSARRGDAKYIVSSPIGRQGAPLVEGLAQLKAGEFIELDLMRILDRSGAPYALENVHPSRAFEYPTAREQLFDLTTDPMEQTDLAQGDPESALSHRRALLGLLEAMAANGGTPSGEAQVHFTEQHREELEAMGYLE